MQTSDRNHHLSQVLITLMKGVTYMETDPPLWQALLGLQARVREHLAVLGLELIDAHGFAILDRLRAAFPKCRSILMDRETLMAHRDFRVEERSPSRAAPDQGTGGLSRASSFSI